MPDELSSKLRDEIEALKVGQAVMMAKQESNCALLKEIHGMLIGDGSDEKPGILLRLDRIEGMAVLGKWLAGALAALWEEHARHFWFNGK